MRAGEGGKGCGRGVLALQSWELLRKPGGNSQKSKETANNSTTGNQNIPKAPCVGATQTLMAKYSYKSNPDQPGGFPELTVKQGQKVEFLNTHPEQPLWWNVKDMGGGESGYVPASYMMVLSDKPTSLPWLDNQKLEEKKEEQKPQAGNGGVFGEAPVNTWKPYVSAYGGGATNAPAGVATEGRRYYCEVCDKQLNGPKPYQAHMVSKAHKEEVEAQSYNP